MTIPKTAEALLSLLPGAEIRTGEPLSAHTTFRIGGPADVFCVPKNAKELAEIIRFTKSENLPFFILGAGSNLLVGDGGIRGVVVYTGMVDSISQTGENSLQAECGAKLARLALTAQSLSLCGLEFAQGIPGSVGGAVFMNAGAYGDDLSGVTYEVDYLDESGEIFTASGTELNFGYRSSFLSAQPGCTVLRARFRLKRGNVSDIASLMSDYRTRRKTTQPLEYPSAGSAFKRPPGHFAGKLISDAGLKGLSFGGAQVSEKHAGFIINTGSATARDVLTLIDKVKAAVFADSGIMLEQEIRVVGEL